MNRVQLDEVVAQPWRNGGGLTRELLAWPASAACASACAHGWLLRVSVAEVARDGVFSAFAGVTRWFAVISGGAVRLSLPGGTVEASTQGKPVCFDGAWTPACQLIDGPTQDLNLMAPTHAGNCSMRRADAGSGIGASTGWRGLYAAQAVDLHVDGVRQAVAAGTLLWCDDAGPSTWQLPADSAPVQAWWLSWQPR